LIGLFPKAPFFAQHRASRRPLTRALQSPVMEWRSINRVVGLLLLVVPSLELCGQTYGMASFQSLLPADAKIIEIANLRIPSGKSRVLVLWMLHPARNTRRAFEGFSDQVYGDHWRGPTRISLVDGAAMKLMNTVEVRGAYDDHDEFSIPFFVSRYFYHVVKPNRKNEGAPRILHLRDLTAEGVSGQFVLFEYEVSGIAMTSVFGYSPATDAAVQFHVERVENGEEPEIMRWISHTFQENPIRPGYWKFTWEPGHGADAWIDEEVRFDIGRQIFVDQMTVRPYSDIPVQQKKGRKESGKVLR
jgi:hypothetical protein